jgi:hypothetical protein
VEPSGSTKLVVAKLPHRTGCGGWHSPLNPATNQLGVPGCE